MVTNIVFSKEMFVKNVWSVQLFLPQEEIQINNEYRLVKIEDLVSERKESIALTPEDYDVNYIGLENIESNTGRLVCFSPKCGTDIKSTCKKFYKKDILYGRLRPNLNKVLFADNFDFGVCTTEILVLVPNLNLVNPIYLAELLRTTIINKRIVNMIKGAALPRISMSDLKQLAIPIPSLEKQNLYAEEILRKRAELEEHIKLAQMIPAELDQYISSAFTK